ADRAPSRVRGAVQDRRLVPDSRGPRGRADGHRVLTPPVRTPGPPPRAQYRQPPAENWVAAAAKPGTFPDEAADLATLRSLRKLQRPGKGGHGAAFHGCP